MDVKFICTNQHCNRATDQVYELVVQAESIMDEKNIATFFCPHCNEKLTCEGCPTAA